MTRSPFPTSVAFQIRSLTTEKAMWYKVRPAIIVFFLVVSHYANAQDSSALVQLFPGTKIFPLFTADGLSHQLSLSRVTENKDWIAAIGASIPAVQLDLGNTQMQAGVAVTIFNRLIKTPGHITVYTIDYKVDVPIDIHFSDLSFRAAMGHMSCHFADDGIELLGQRSIQYANDYVTFAAAYEVAAIQGYVYTGFNYSYGTQPVQNRPWLIQVGVEFGNIDLYKEVSLYGAIDVKTKEEVGWGSTRSFQIGVKLFPHLRYRLRMAYTLRMGYEDRGQFYLNEATRSTYGMFIDF